MFHCFPSSTNINVAMITLVNILPVTMDENKERLVKDKK